MSVLYANKSHNEEGIGMNKFRNEEIEVDFVFIVFWTSGNAHQSCNRVIFTTRYRVLYIVYSYFLHEFDLHFTWDIVYSITISVCSVLFSR